MQFSDIKAIYNHARFKIQIIEHLPSQKFWLLHIRKNKVIRSIEMRPREKIEIYPKVIKFDFACPIVLIDGDRYDVVNFPEKALKNIYRFRN